jgi:hypothetical protein
MNGGRAASRLRRKIAMADWTLCPHCRLRHSARGDGHCPRCGESTLAAATPVNEPAAPLPDVYDGRDFPGSTYRRSGRAEEADDVYDTAFGKFITAGACFGMAWHFQGQFAQLESGQVESIRVWWLVALLYQTVGSTVAVALIALLGVVAAIGWINKLGEG